jgi:UDP-3-O-[3-hydroxymyristoyl] glucosamine N-acyltransferase
MGVAARPTPLAEIAGLLGREVEGDATLLVSGVAALEKAGPGDIAFVRSAQLADQAVRSGAGALILPCGLDVGSRTAIRSPNPALDFARVVERIAAPAQPEPGVDHDARVASDASVHPTAMLSAGVVVGRGARIGARSVLYPGVIVYSDVQIGEDCVLHSGTVLRERTSLGNRVVCQPGALIGADGFGYIADEEGRPHRIPHVGCVVIEDDVEIGAGTTIDRGTLDETRVRRGAKIDNLVQIAHNCDIGENAIVVAQTGLSGSTVIGRGAVLMARVGSTGHLRVGEGAFVGAATGLHKDVAPGGRVWGSPQLEGRRWHRAMAALAQLPAALRRLRAVERALGLRDEVREPDREE